MRPTALRRRAASNQGSTAEPTRGAGNYTYRQCLKLALLVYVLLKYDATDGHTVVYVCMYVLLKFDTTDGHTVTLLPYICMYVCIYTALLVYVYKYV